MIYFEIIILFKVDIQYILFSIILIQVIYVLMYNVEIVLFYKQDKESMFRVMRQVDKVNGYVFGDLEERDIQFMMFCVVQVEFEYEKIKDVREKYMDIEIGDINMDN